MEEGSACMHALLRKPTFWVKLTTHLIVLAVRYNNYSYYKIFFIGLGEIEVDRSCKFSNHYWVHQVPR